jgi:hypothetical protein
MKTGRYNGSRSRRYAGEEVLQNRKQEIAGNNGLRTAIDSNHTTRNGYTITDISP